MIQGMTVFPINHWLYYIPQELKPDPNENDFMDVISPAMDVTPELLATVDYDDAPEYSDPIDLASVHNEPSNRHRELIKIILYAFQYAQRHK